MYLCVHVAHMTAGIPGSFRLIFHGTLNYGVIKFLWVTFKIISISHLYFLKFSGYWGLNFQKVKI